jgi:hypothetical protein
VAANVWCCTVTGRVHVCDEACSEKVVDRSTGLLVCPISGATSDRMMSSAEEELEEGLAARGAEEGGGGPAEDDFGGGWLEVGRGVQGGCCWDGVWWCDECIGGCAKGQCMGGQAS